MIADRAALYRYGRAGGDVARLYHDTQGFAELVLLIWSCMPADTRRAFADPEVLAQALSPHDMQLGALAGALKLQLFR